MLKNRKDPGKKNRLNLSRISAVRLLERGPLYVTSAGGNAGLAVRMHTHQYEYYEMTSGYGAGFKMLVHDPNTQPLIGQLGTLIAPGFEMEIALFLHETRMKGPPYDSDCFNMESEDYKNPLTYYNHYAKDTCILDCYVNYLASECKCLPYDIEMENRNMEYCNAYESINCITPARSRFDQNSTHQRLCGCKHTCHELQFTTSVSSSLLPNSYISPLMQSDTGMDLPQLRENIIQLRIFYSSMSFQEVLEEAAYSVKTLGGDVGGMMGLCLGCSILTVFELFEFIGMMCKYQINVQKRSK